MVMLSLGGTRSASSFDRSCGDLLCGVALGFKGGFLHCRAGGDIGDCSGDGGHATGGAADCGCDIACHFTSRADDFTSRLDGGGSEVNGRVDYGA